MFLKEIEFTMDFFWSSEEGHQIRKQIKQLEHDSEVFAQTLVAAARTVSIGSHTIFRFVALKEHEFQIYGELGTLRATYLEEDTSIRTTERIQVEFDLDTLEVYSSDPVKRRAAIDIIQMLIKSKESYDPNPQPRDLKIADVVLQGFLHATRVGYEDREDTIHVTLEYMRQI